MSEADLNKYTVPQLKQMIEEKGATPVGKKKADFVQQLLGLTSNGAATPAHEGSSETPAASTEAAPQDTSSLKDAPPDPDASEAPPASQPSSEAKKTMDPEAEAQKRAARAARFGIPIAPPPSAPTSSVTSTESPSAPVPPKKEPSTVSAKPEIDEETLRKRREKFGVVEPAVSVKKEKEAPKEKEKVQGANGSAKSTEAKQSTPVDPETAEKLRQEAEKRAARAARFGNPTESTKVSLEDDDKKRKAESEANGESAEKKAKVD